MNRTGNQVGTKCYFCNSNNLGLFKKELPTTKLIICQLCIKSITIEHFTKTFKYYPQSIQNLTLFEITDDNHLDFKPTNSKIN